MRKNKKRVMPPMRRTFESERETAVKIPNRIKHGTHFIEPSERRKIETLCEECYLDATLFSTVEKAKSEFKEYDHIVDYRCEKCNSYVENGVTKEGEF